jgi:hypothetical protein
VRVAEIFLQCDMTINEGAGFMPLLLDASIHEIR